MDINLDPNTFEFDFDFDLAAHIDNYLIAPQPMSAPIDVPVTANFVVTDAPQEQEQDIFNNWVPTQAFDNCAATSNAGNPEPQQRTGPKRGRPRSDNPKNPENTKRLREQRIKDKEKKETFQLELEALKLEVAELERDEALMSELISETQKIYFGMIGSGELC